MIKAPSFLLNGMEIWADSRLGLGRRLYSWQLNNMFKSFIRRQEQADHLTMRAGYFSSQWDLPHLGGEI